MPIVVNTYITIPDTELSFSTSRSSGPGGQHVNTTDSRVSLSWSVATSAVLSDPQRARLLARLQTRLTADGTLTVHVDDHRSQLRNREIAAERLAALVREGLVVPKSRKQSRPSRSAVEKRLNEKRAQSDKKADRRRRDD